MRIHTYHAVPLPFPCRSLAVPLPFPCRSLAVPLPFPCRSLAVPLPCRSDKGFPIWFTQCGRVWFTHKADSHIPCHGMCESNTASLCKSKTQSKPLAERHGRGTAWERHGNGMGTAWERHGMCESAFILPATSRWGCLIPSWKSGRKSKNIFRQMVDWVGIRVIELSQPQGLKRQMRGA
jgi:hypothetical protein